MDLLLHIIGWIGVSLILLGYFLNAKQLISSKSKAYLFMNLFGALGIVINSFYLSAWPQMSLNVAWFFIAAHGLWQYRRDQ